MSGAGIGPASPGSDTAFDYATAFSRNLGWVTEWEQQALRVRRVAIAGLGGVGGSHLVTLARLGVGGFNIADLDRFDLVNFNRQAGARMDTLGRPKVDVAAEMALGINPELRITRFPEGVNPENIDSFLAGCDLYVDGLDFFVLGIRAAVFARCAELGIPAITAAPIGMGVGFLAFLPGGMTFEQYFRLAGHAEEEQYLRFLMGVAPAGLHRTYLVDDTRVDLAGKRGPSTAAACELCAGMIATQATKLLLGRGGVPHAPDHLHFDAYRGRLARTRLRWGNAGPLQRLKLAVARRMYRGMTRRAAAPPPPPQPDPLMRILDLARWAPSGDNQQPWRFDPVDGRTVRVHLDAPDPANPYEYRDGEPILLAGGMLLESLRIAARANGRTMEWRLELATPPWRLLARLEPDPQAPDALQPDPLAAALPLRSVARGPLGSRRLTALEKTRLQDALGSDLAITWHEGPGARLRVARLGQRATDIRLRAPETFPVHRRMVDWDRPHSPTGLPARALGLDRPTLRMMRWAMQDQSRMDRVNTLFGTWSPALQLDVWPALRSSAFFTVRLADTADHEGAAGEEGTRAMRLLRAGERLQRFWLTAVDMGLAVQPWLAPLIFADYGRRGAAFTSDARLREKAAALARQAGDTLGPIDTMIFIGRIGVARPGLPGPRSVRRPTAELLRPPSQPPGAVPD